MAVMSGARFTGTAQGTLMSRYDIVCIHTIVGYAPAPAAHFSISATGYIWQSRDTRYRSGANLEGNHRIIAIENEDHGPRFGAWNTADGHQVPWFTPEQVESIAQICAWAHKTHGIPLVPCPDSKPGSRGIAYHRQGIDGNWAGYAYGGRVAGGEVWTKARGKVCPGDRRIAQLLTQIIPRARQLAGLESPKDPTVKNLVIAHAQNDPAHWVGDGIRRRKISDPTELADLLYLVGQMGGSNTVRVINNLKVLGEVDQVLPAVVPVEIDYARFVTDVVTRLSAELTATGVSLSTSELAEIAQLTAIAAADEIDRRVRDNDPTTGPRS